MQGQAQLSLAVQRKLDELYARGVNPNDIDDRARGFAHIAPWTARRARRYCLRNLSGSRAVPCQISCIDERRGLLLGAGRVRAGCDRPVQQHPEQVSVPDGRAAKVRHSYCRPFQQAACLSAAVALLSGIKRRVSWAVAAVAQSAAVPVHIITGTPRCR